MSGPLFVVLTPENTAHVTISDNWGEAPAQAVVTLNCPKAICLALSHYARKHDLAAARVAYSVRYPEVTA